MERKYRSRLRQQPGKGPIRKPKASSRSPGKDDYWVVDAEHGDFRLKPQSPALKQSFEVIPLDKFGPYEDGARATWPIQEAEGVREHPEWFRSVPIDD